MSQLQSPTDVLTAHYMEIQLGEVYFLASMTTSYFNKKEKEKKNLRDQGSNGCFGVPIYQTQPAGRNHEDVMR